ncbi:MAG: hypothetical protein ABSD57_06225 [Verrucomicrobiota bacterium]
MAAMTCERFLFEKTSAIASGAHSTWTIFFLKVRQLRFARFADEIGIFIFEGAGEFVAEFVQGRVQTRLAAIGCE